MNVRSFFGFDTMSALEATFKSPTTGSAQQAGERAASKAAALPGATASKGERSAARILEAAASLFAAQGYAAVSMRQIAGEVGLGQGALYNHFASKQAILMAIQTRHMQGLLQAWQAADPGRDCPLTRFKAFVHFHIGYHRHRAREVFLSYMELRSLEPANLAPIVAARAEYEGILRQTLADGQAAGQLKAGDAALTAKALIAMLSGLTNWYQEGGRLAFEKVQDHYSRLALRLVGDEDSQGDLPEIQTNTPHTKIEEAS